MFPPCSHGLAAYKCVECLHADNKRLRAALEAVRQYGADTLTGRVDGPDDRDWQHGAVLEMTKRARQALGVAQETKHDDLKYLLDLLQRIAADMNVGAVSTVLTVYDYKASCRHWAGEIRSVLAHETDGIDGRPDTRTALTPARNEDSRSVGPLIDVPADEMLAGRCGDPMAQSAPFRCTKPTGHEGEHECGGWHWPAAKTKPSQCDPDDHLYAAAAGSPFGDGVCIKCGAKEPSENGGVGT